MIEAMTKTIVSEEDKATAYNRTIPNSFRPNGKRCEKPTISASSGKISGKNCFVVSPTMLIIQASTGNIKALNPNHFLSARVSLVANILCQRSGATMSPMLPRNKNPKTFPHHIPIGSNSLIGIDVFPNKTIATVMLITSIITNWKKSVLITALKPARSKYVRTMPHHTKSDNAYGRSKIDENTFPATTRFAIKRNIYCKIKIKENISQTLFQKR